MKVDYGLRVLVHLAQQPHATPVPASEIASSQRIPEAYLNQIFSNLQRAGMIISRRGPQGGHMLARAPEQITVAEVVTCFDRSLAPLDCVHSPGECTLSGACSQRELWSDVERALLELLSRTRVSDLVAKQKVLAWAAT
ncbi:MAG: Rrf2 family transcriptional regulator [Dehalococcoidia bacterium]|jgi:Rrf2 family protein